MPTRNVLLATFFSGLATLAFGSVLAAPELFPEEQLKPGLKGVATTVIAGGTAQQIPVEILGIVPNGIGPGVNLILARLQGEVGEWNGVAAGMSGSPVMIDGKLVGALSYAIGQFAKEPICGITPIRAMLAHEKYPGGALPWRTTNDSSITPLPVTLSVGGFSPSVLDRLPAVLHDLDVAWPVSFALAASGGPTASTAASFQPGQPVSALLVWGDVQIGASGTVSYVDGERILAFGHPFLGSGRVSAPLAAAEVVWTVPSLLNSFKIARIGEPAGTWDQDRLTGISGRIGPIPPGIPVALTIARVDRPALIRRFAVMKDPYLTPILIALAMRGQVIEEVGADRDESLSMSGTIFLRGGRTLPLELQAAGGLAGSPDGALANELTKRVTDLTRAPLDLPEIERIELTIRSQQPDGGWRIKRALPDRLAAKPGEALNVVVDLESPRGALRRERLALTVPPQQPPGNLALLISSERAFIGETGSLEEARRRTARSVDDYLAALANTHSDTTLHAALMIAAEGFVGQGREYPALPGSATLLLRSRPGGFETYRARFRALTTASVTLDRPVGDVARLTIEVLP